MLLHAMSNRPQHDRLSNTMFIFLIPPNRKGPLIAVSMH